jgi:hypothetical protein
MRRGWEPANPPQRPVLFMNPKVGRRQGGAGRPRQAGARPRDRRDRPAPGRQLRSGFGSGEGCRTPWRAIAISAAGHDQDRPRQRRRWPMAWPGMLRRSTESRRLTPSNAVGDERADRDPRASRYDRCATEQERTRLEDSFEDALVGGLSCASPSFPRGRPALRPRCRGPNTARSSPHSDVLLPSPSCGA